MKNFLKKLAYYDGDRYLKRALAQVTPQPVDINAIKRNWKLSVDPALKTIASMRTEIDTAIRSITSETGAWGWMTGTNEDYRTAAQYLNEAKRRSDYLERSLTQLSQYIEQSQDASGFSNLGEYSESIKENFDSINKMITQVGSGEISGNSDITEYLIPVQESMKSLGVYCNRLSQTLTSAIQAATQQQQGQQTSPQSPESPGNTPSQSKKEWVNEAFPDDVWNQNNTDTLENVKYHTTGDKIFIQQVEKIKEELPSLNADDIDNSFKDSNGKYLDEYNTEEKRKTFIKDRLEGYNDQVDSVAERMRALIDKRKTYLNTLKSQGKLDEAAYKGLMDNVTLLESTIPKRQNSLPKS